MASAADLKASEISELAEGANAPVLVSALVLLNVSIFILEILTGGSSNTSNLIRFGAEYGPLIEEREYWRFVTSAFLHVGFLHILFNMLCLWLLGRPLERLYGTAQFGFTYLVSGAAGSLLSFLGHEFIAPRAVAAGASGAIFGVAGAMFVAGLRFEYLIPENLQKVFGVGALPFIVYNLYYGFAARGVDNYAHLGGVTAGALCGLFLKPQHETRRESWLATAAFVLLVLIAFAIQFWAGKR